MTPARATAEEVPRSHLQRLSLAGFSAVLIAAALTGRVVLEGQAELAESDAAFDQGQLLSSLEHARRSATLYAPGAPHVSSAYQRLTAIALGAESAGQPKLAFLAWQAERSAALESRHVFVPRRSELERANRNLARLEALAREAKDGERGQTQARALSRLDADEAPAPGWIAVMGVGFLMALTGLALAAFRGVRPNGQRSLLGARMGLVLFAIGAACWTLAAYKA